MQEEALDQAKRERKEAKKKDALNPRQERILKMRHGFSILSALFNAAGVRGCRVAWIEWRRYVTDMEAERNYSMDGGLVEAVYTHMDERMAKLQAERDEQLEENQDIRNELNETKKALTETKIALSVVTNDKFEAIQMAENLIRRRWRCENNANMTEQFRAEEIRWEERWGHLLEPSVPPQVGASFPVGPGEENLPPRL